MMVALAGHWTTQLRGLIQSLEPLGSFAYTERLTNVPQLLPHVTVAGIGRLGFPMLDMAADKLIEASEKAPYGKLDQTLMDTNVRDAWQIDASKITIGGGNTWTAYFNQVVRRHCFQLGISYERFDSLGIQANLYKLLIYEKHGHFLTHRDTEKESYMFGTLLLQLPTSDGFRGGEFTVSHRSVVKSIDLSFDSEFQTVSFYADCEHELSPITDGKRVCLVYNLVATTPEKAAATTIPSPDVNIDTESKLRSICDEWRSTDLKAITKIGYQLEHQYTHQSLEISTLKGRDEVVVTTLRNARNPQGDRLFDVSILLMQHLFEKNHLANYYTDEVEPYVVIEENSDGVWVRKLVNDIGCSDDWDMKCHSKNGWWVMPYENLDAVMKKYMTRAKTNVGNDNIGAKSTAMKNDTKQEDAEGERNSTKKENEDEDSDKYEDEDEEYGYPDEDDDKIPSDRKMFLTTCDSMHRENAYNGNDGGSHETFYFAAAIVVSPKNKVVSRNQPKGKKQKM